MSTRRNFLKQMGLASAGLAMASVPDLMAHAPTPIKSEHLGEKVRIAYIGIGNRGIQNIAMFARTKRVEVTALCDIDLGAEHTRKALDMYPDAKRFRDYRELFDKYSDHFDAVCASVPDHAHFPIAMLALSHGKHIYCEKPMCRTFHEGELMIQMADRHPNVVTQVGNQGHSSANFYQWKTWQEAGIIKDVTAITAHMNHGRPWFSYDLNMKHMPQGEALPNPDIDWDAWLGVCPWRDYSEYYHLGQWRSWYEFGNGVMGDWGLHILDTAHRFLELGYPYEISLTHTAGHTSLFYPYESTVLFRFGPRNGMPPCDITWYDGLNNQPELPENYGESIFNPNVPPSNQGDTPDVALNPGKIIYSKDIIFKGGTHDSTLVMLPSEAASEWESKLPEVPECPSDHYENFLNAIEGTVEARSPFRIAGVLSQVFCLGVIAQRLNARLFFDPRTKQFTNNEFANAMLVGAPPRQGWEDFYTMQ